MWPYWLLFLVPALQASTKLRVVKEISKYGSLGSGQWRFIFVTLVLIIGFRHQVGGDWFIYLRNVESTADLTLVEALNSFRGDPTDNVLNWVGAHSGLGIYFVNTVYAIFFTLGLLVFCHRQPRPWLALTVAVPYLVTVVAMGYSRQGAAIGLVMLGLVALEYKQVTKFLLWVGFAATIHKSAVILIPLAVLAGSRNRLVKACLVGITAALLYVLC